MMGEGSLLRFYSLFFFLIYFIKYLNKPNKKTASGLIEFFIFYLNKLILEGFSICNYSIFFLSLVFDKIE